jgi:thiosulfate dehydrogenase
VRGLLCVCLVAGALASGCSGDAEPIVVHGTAIDHGMAIFQDPAVAGTDLNTYSCATCHSAEGVPAADVVLPGGSLTGVTKRPYYWAGQELDLLRSINACLYYFMLEDEPWTAEDEQARALWAYLDSISQGPEGTEPTPFTVSVAIADLPQGDATRGEQLYGRACASCHGASHTGADKLVERAPTLPDQTLADHPLGEYTADEQRLVFVEKARHGAFLAYTGTMPPFSLEVLPDEDLADILSYLDLY